ncbi:MAG TPA: methionine--tRNA ligase [Candidatus Nanopelagicaceae bacterium]|nr:methionine--tRNA ligase [Candidatus Nanopelagicaceae bacterium]
MSNTKKDKWVITSAWPNANYIPHLGNMIGSTLSSDVFARYCRLKGDEVVFVSGSDSHGTPVAVAAKKLNIPAEELAIKNHTLIKDLYEKWKISYDNYTVTYNPIHIDFTRKFYLEVQQNGYVFEREIESLYCEHDKFFLPDRFVEGICPHCGDENARGDQCDKCQKLLTPLELKTPRCAICNNTPIVRKTKHWYLDLPKLQDRLEELIKNNTIIPQNARQMCLNSIAEGIPERAITRDLEWGIPAPFKGADEKTIYVWFEAVLGYISAVKEWAENIVKDSKKFEYFWNDPDTKTVFFIGKDNIIFHLIVFPGLLLAYNNGKSKAERFVLPYNVSSTEFLMYENDKFSKSRGNGIWIDEALKLAPLDYWRFSLVYNRPETSDTSFLWSEFENNIKTLNDNIGNFIHRTLTFIDKQFEGKIPKKLENDEFDIQFIDRINSISEEIGESIQNFKLRKALRDIVNFGKEGNVYLNNKAPWHLIKKDKDAAGHVFNICAQAVYAFAVLLSPFIPETSEKIISYLNVPTSKDLAWCSIDENAIREGLKIKKPEPLFQKLEIDDLQKALQEIRKTSERKGEKKLVSYEDFKKLDIRIAVIDKVEKVPKADKLYKLSISLGEEKRILVAGLAEQYKIEELKGKSIAILANLEPRKLRGILSEGMLLAAVDGKNVSILTPDRDIPAGAKIE